MDIAAWYAAEEIDVEKLKLVRDGMVMAAVKSGAGLKQGANRAGEQSGGNDTNVAKRPAARAP
eukprot:4307573-Alexandrium_andersonii.AAC.1